MTIRNVCSIVIALVAIQFLHLEDAYSQPSPLSAKELIEHESLKAYADALRDGDIVMLKQPERESANQLNVLMLVLARAKMKETVDTLQRQATAEDGPGILAIGEIGDATPTELDQAFAGLMFTPQERAEVEKMMSVGAGDDFNFSLDEIASINKKAASLNAEERKGAAAVDAMSGAIREVLKGRYLSYRKKGLDGLAPYQFGSSKQVHPSAELIAATESMRLVKERFPDYYGCLRFYPEKKPPELMHQFYWAKQTESNRPLFVLKHWILDIRSDYALITERRFYLNHSLNSLQVGIACLPHGDSTLVVLLNQAFTEKVNMTIGKSIAKAIGHKEVEKNIRPIFENLRTALRR